jgi:hypothetical protein
MMMCAVPFINNKQHATRVSLISYSSSSVSAALMSSIYAKYSASDS